MRSSSSSLSHRLLLSLSLHSRPKPIGRNTKSKRLFCSAGRSGSTSTSSSSSSTSRVGRPHYDHKKTRRPAIRNKPKPKPQSQQRQRQRPFQRRNNNNNNESNSNSNNSRYDGNGTNNELSASSSVASSIMDMWAQDRTIHNYNNSNINSSKRHTNSNRNTSVNSNANRNRNSNRNTLQHSTRNSFQFDRFRDRRQEYCRVMEEYRSFWYPQKATSTTGPTTEATPSITTTMMTMTTAFDHPDPDEELPWMNLSWERILESEDLFRRVCASHHNLFIACSSCLTEITEIQKNSSFNYNSNSNSNKYGDDRHRARRKPTAVTEYNNDYNEEDLFRANCEELHRTILPRWETLRRERAALVNRYRPSTEEDGDGGNGNGNGDDDYNLSSGVGKTQSRSENQQQQVSPWATTTTTTTITTPSSSSSSSSFTSDTEDRLETNLTGDEEQTVSSVATKNNRSIKENYDDNHNRNDSNQQQNNNRWGGWLKKMITGDENNFDNNNNGTNANNNNHHHLLATAHLDPECAPNHYHYTQLIGQMYFHYLPLKLHIRKNPFHIYSKSEREEGMATKGEKEDCGDTDGDHDDDDDHDDNDDDGDHDHDHNHDYNTAGGLDKQQIGANRNESAGTGLPETATSAAGGNSHSIPYQVASAAYKQRRREILEDRAEKMQYVVDHALLPLTPTPPSRNSTTTQLQEDDSNRVLTDKIVRLLIRSYLDQGYLEAAQQAERIYHRHPNHRKHLLWYVAMSYLKVIKSTPKQGGIYGKEEDKLANTNTNTNANANANMDESATAAKRICELVSSKYAKEAREFQHCSAIAFEALAILPEHSRRELKGYHDRVHSLGILKFGPKVWEALIHGNDNDNDNSNVIGNGKDKKHTHGGNGDQKNDVPPRGRKENSNYLQSSTDSSLPSIDSAGTKNFPPPLVVNLSQSLNSKDHKILHHLIQIYSSDENYFDRALRLLDVSLEIYPAYALQKSLTRSSFHELLRHLLAKNEKDWDKMKASRNSSLPKKCEGSSRELDTAFRILDKMVLHEWWFPNEDTFRILFSIAACSDNPAPGTERLLAKLEACRFLSNLSPLGSHAPSSNNKTTQQTFDGSGPSLAPHLFSPLEASMYALNAWAQTAHHNNHSVPPGHPHPAERAWAILQALRVESSPPLLLSADDVDTKSSSWQGLSNDHRPNEALYTLALKVCLQIFDSRQCLEVALDIFGAVQKDGLLLEGDVCRVLLGAITCFSNSDSDNIRRIEATKIVYRALLELNPNFGEVKPDILSFLRKQASYLRIRHPGLYENHLAELELLEAESSEI